MGSAKNFQFLVLMVIVVIAAVECVPIDDKELKNNRNCKNLCSHCGCMGFYCGEECICECNGNKKESSQCIETMQGNAIKLKIPFEILIQGPSKNGFLKNALQFNQDQQCTKKDYRNKRSTVVIYKPDNQYIENDSKLDGTSKSIQKRSVSENEWYANADSSIVKPAPVQGIMSLIKELDVVPVSDSMDSSSTNLLPKLKIGLVGLKDLLSHHQKDNDDDDDDLFGYGDEKCHSQPTNHKLDFDIRNSKIYDALSKLKLKSLDLDLGGSKLHDVLTNIKLKADDLFNLEKAKVFFEKLHDDSIFAKKDLTPEDSIECLFKD